MVPSRYHQCEEKVPTAQLDPTVSIESLEQHQRFYTPAGRLLCLVGLFITLVISIFLTTSRNRRQPMRVEVEAYANPQNTKAMAVECCGADSHHLPFEDTQLSSQVLATNARASRETGYGWPMAAASVARRRSQVVSQWRNTSLGVTVARELDQIFATRRDGWLGGDVATSFAFPGPSGVTRDIWLFGDTLLGRSDQLKRLPNFVLLHNSLAFVTRGVKPDPDDVTFHWNISAGGCPTSIFVLEHVDNECRPGHEYLWPISGLGVAYGTVSKVVVQAVRWRYSPPSSESGGDGQGKAPLGFQILGTVVIVVDNPHDTPRSWRYRMKSVPGTDGDVNWFSAMAVLPRHEASATPDFATSPDETVLLFGVNGTNTMAEDKHDLAYRTLGRIAVRDLVDLRLDRLEVWSTRQGKHRAKWKHADKMEDSGRISMPLQRPAFSEASVRYSTVLGSWYQVSVNWATAQIMLSLAEAVTGPWETIPVYNIPAPYDDVTRFICYAGKSHPDLAQDRSEIVLSYSVNSLSGFGPLFEVGGKDIYVPHFVRVRLKRREDSA